jgi:hypothetical protein
MVLATAVGKVSSKCLRQLDDYSPLRKLTKEALEEEAKIFPIKPSLAT